MRYIQAHPDLSLSGHDERDWGGYTATPDAAHVIASYQHAIVEAISDRVRTALDMHPRKAFVLGGGVSLNSGIRKSLSAICSERGVKLYMAKPKYTGDNAAMIAGLAMYRRRVEGEEAMRMDATPALEIGDICAGREALK
jgi:N6-L-threonylcarbamoyladenine synthase